MLSDNMKALQSNLCPKALDFDTASERGEVLASPTEEKKEKDGVKGSIQYEMEATKKEIRRLQLLKEMQLERQRLADLIAKKRTKECYLSERFFGGTISQKNKVEHDTTWKRLAFDFSICICYTRFSHDFLRPWCAWYLTIAYRRVGCGCFDRGTVLPI